MKIYGIKYSVGWKEEKDGKELKLLKDYTP
jgi:hypothetical protein